MSQPETTHDSSVENHGTIILFYAPLARSKYLVR